MEKILQQIGYAADVITIITLIVAVLYTLTINRNKLNHILSLFLMNMFKTLMFISLTSVIFLIVTSIISSYWEQNLIVNLLVTSFYSAIGIFIWWLLGGIVLNFSFNHIKSAIEVIYPKKLSIVRAVYGYHNNTLNVTQVISKAN